ncbi:hypothetical protein [Bacillus sp. V2I10]|uniref:hypothetical protein n=1 Tax=Bacillus sp. V2I10 TaxID=3042276 RepID=UPI00277FF442|nr:hypothetical protein [Bacillus sp. V2I10]MDQ0861406.1 hypothetical protein [Bacillus sp. V2I10]
MKNKETHEQKDMEYEGRDQAFLDIDRMINEGLSGGSVHMRDMYTNIEEARDFEQEEPPAQNES